jgi:2'-5' RNA ligase
MNEGEIELPERIRLFVALQVPEAVKDEIESAQTNLRRQIKHGELRWASRAQFHLTLRFLGAVEATRTEDLCNALRSACQKLPWLELSASGLGFFSSRGIPRVVWVGVSTPGQELLALHRAVEGATAGFTAEPTEKSFTGHITLVRVKTINRPDSQLLMRCASDLNKKIFGEWTAREIELVQSRLSPKGATHTPIAAIPLASA